MRLDHEHAFALLHLVDPGRVRSGRAVGLRDRAVLALVAADFTTLEIAAFRASVVTLEGRKVVLSIEPRGIPWRVELSPELGRWLSAWLTAAKLWGLDEPLFRGCRGPLTPMGIWKIFERYRSLEEATALRKAA